MIALHGAGWLDDNPAPALTLSARFCHGHDLVHSRPEATWSLTVDRIQGILSVLANEEALAVSRAAAQEI